MTAVRRRSLAPVVHPVSAPAAPGAHPPAGACFASVLQTLVQEVEHADDDRLPPVEPVRASPGAPVPAGPGPLIVAGIVFPAPLPR